MRRACPATLEHVRDPEFSIFSDAPPPPSPHTLSGRWRNQEGRLRLEAYLYVRFGVTHGHIANTCRRPRPCPRLPSGPAPTAQTVCQVTGRAFTPSVIEPSFGIGRILWCVLEQVYYIRESSLAALGDKSQPSKDKRAVFALPAAIAAYKVPRCAPLFHAWRTALSASAS